MGLTFSGFIITTGFRVSGFRVQGSEVLGSYRYLLVSGC
jgi:hypothetical protein